MQRRLPLKWDGEARGGEHPAEQEGAARPLGESPCRSLDGGGASGGAEPPREPPPRGAQQPPAAADQPRRGLQAEAGDGDDERGRRVRVTAEGEDGGKDEEGEPFYYERKTGTTSYRHPADEYFINKVLEDRTRHVKAVQEGAAVRLSEPWLDFMEANGSRYWYNFRTGQRTASAPLGVHAQHGALLADDTSDRTGPSRTHSGSFDPSWAPKLTPSAETREMKRNTCPEREGVLGEFLSDENVLDSVEEGLAAGDTRQEQFQHPQPSLLPTNPLTSQAAEPPWEQARQLSASPASLTASSLAPSPGVKTAAHMQGRFAAPPPPAGMPGGYVRHKLGAGTEFGGVDAAIEARVKAAAARNAWGARVGGGSAVSYHR